MKSNNACKDCEIAVQAAMNAYELNPSSRGPSPWCPKHEVEQFELVEKIRKAFQK